MFISTIERFITEKLNQSTLIPSHVDIVRLANTLEDQGIVNQGSYISVAFDGSSTNIVQKNPLMMIYTLTFRLEFSSQQYNATEGHDQCFILMAAAIEELLNAYPMGSGYEIENPLMLITENFIGITDNSQFVYSQLWELDIMIKRECLPEDPCIRRGFCGFGIGKDVIFNMPFGHVHDNMGRIYTFNPNGEIVLENADGEIVVNGLTIMDHTMDIQLGGYNENGYLTSVHIFDSDGNIVASYPVYLTGKYLLTLDLNIYRNKIVDVAQFDTTVQAGYSVKTENPAFNYARALYETYFYLDPTDGNADRVLQDEGKLILVRSDISLEVGGVTYIKAFTLDGMSGWVIEDFILEVGDPTATRLITEC